LNEFTSVKPPAMMVTRVDDAARYGVVNLEDDLLKGIDEKPKQPKNNLVNTGIYAFNRDVFDLHAESLDIPDMLEVMLAKGYRIKVCETHGVWMDIVYPWDILSLNQKTIERTPRKLSGRIDAGVNFNGPVSIRNNSRTRSNSYIQGPVVIGENCDIGPSACIMPATSIGNNVVIGPFTTIKNCVICNDVNIGAGCYIENSVIDTTCAIKTNFTACSEYTDVRVNGSHHHINIGTMIGEGCSISNNVTAQPGTVIGNYSQVQAHKLINGRLPDKSLVM
jgi:NDP-sugar pyrophosphorylase family protein